MKAGLVALSILLVFAGAAHSDDDKPRLTFEKQTEQGTNRNRIVIQVFTDQKTGCDYVMLSSSNGGLAVELLEDTCDSKASDKASQTENEVEQTSP